MVKFYLPQAQKKSVPKKNKDYRQNIYNKFYHTIQSQYVHIIHKIVRKLKASHNKKSINDEEKFEQQLKQFKSINKKHMRLLAIYLMIQQLNIKNLDKLAEKIQINMQSIKAQYNQIPSLNSLKQYFLKSKIGQKQINNAQQFCNNIHQKKIQKKSKDKIRKIRKLQIKKTLPKQNINKANNNDQVQIQQQIEAQQIIQKIPTKKQFQSIPKQRTQFKKTGRNKVLYQKKNKKNILKQKHQNNKYENKNNLRPQQNMKDTKDQLHPSWQAKLESNRGMFILPFQGKRTLL